MFILTTVADVVPIDPEDFTKPSAQALQHNINEKYANKIMQGTGLCICFYDLLKASDGMIGHGRGTVYVKAEFRLVIFRPFRGEIIEGTILRADHNGVQVSVGFFDDILVPGPENLFPDCHFDKEEQVWVWKNDGTDLYFDKNERVRFRVEEEIWTDLAPSDQPPKLGQSADAAPPGPRLTTVNDDKGQMKGRIDQEMLSDKIKEDMKSWRLVCSMQQGGLGCVSWW